MSRIAYQTNTEQATQQAQRIQFVLARNTALLRERATSVAKLRTLHGDVARVISAIGSGEPLSDSETVLRFLDKAQAAEAKLVADVKRINSKIR